jgi:Domain of unknown function (DUF4260)
VLLAGSLVAYAATGEPWWLVPLALLVPDLFMAGYLRGTRPGAQLYNIAHSTALPAGMVGLGWWQSQPLVLALGLIWLTHIGMDRLPSLGPPHCWGKCQRSPLSFAYGRRVTEWRGPAPGRHPVRAVVPTTAVILRPLPSRLQMDALTGTLDNATSTRHYRTRASKTSLVTITCSVLSIWRRLRVCEQEPGSATSQLLSGRLDRGWNGERGKGVMT